MHRYSRGPLFVNTKDKRLIIPIVSYLSRSKNTLYISSHTQEGCQPVTEDSDLRPEWLKKDELPKDIGIGPQSQREKNDISASALIANKPPVFESLCCNHTHTDVHGGAGKLFRPRGSTRGARNSSGNSSHDQMDLVEILSRAFHSGTRPM